jgi:protein-S-isoprenylcysteine O-methyltransferase Ste14
LRRSGSNWYSRARSAVIVASFMMRGRMAREEKFLLERSGEEYRDSTNRLVPGLY